MKFVYSPDLDPDIFGVRHPAGVPEVPADGKKPAAKTMADLITATLRDEMKRDERIVIFGEDVADCSREEYLKQKLVKGQGRSLQAHLRPAVRIRQRPRLQFAARRGRHCGPRHRHGNARTEAGRRNSVLRLHLAGDDADSRRAQRHPLALEQWLLLPARDSRRHRRIPDRRRHLSLAVRREHLHAHPRPARRVPVERAGCRWPVAHRDPLRRSGPVPRAQAPVSRILSAARRIPARIT